MTAEERARLFPNATAEERVKVMADAGRISWKPEDQEHVLWQIRVAEEAAQQAADHAHWDRDEKTARALLGKPLPMPGPTPDTVRVGEHKDVVITRAHWLADNGLATWSVEEEIDRQIEAAVEAARLEEQERFTQVLESARAVADGDEYQDMYLEGLVDAIVAYDERRARTPQEKKTDDRS